MLLFLFKCELQLSWKSCWTVQTILKIKWEITKSKNSVFIYILVLMLSNKNDGKQISEVFFDMQTNLSSILL